METESRTEMRRHRSCCISREFLSAASSKPDKVAVIHAAGGALRSRRRRLAYDGDECFTYSQLLTAVDSLTARIRNILDGGDDPCLTRPSTSTCSSEHAHNWSSEHVPSSEHLNNVSMQSTEVPVQGKTKTVGVYMFPSVEYIIAVFSILRCGEAFMPLDPSWPNERILSVLSSSNADLILYREHQEPISVHNEHRKSQSVLDSCQWPLLSVSLDQSHAVETGSAQQDLLCPCESRKSRKFSYLMYTSGSTGKPKGVCGTEEGLLNRFWWLQELYPLHKEELLLFKTSISFIDHIQEFLAAMLTACTLVIPAITELRRNISIIIDFVQDYKISRLTATPSLLRAVIPALQTPDHVQICNLKLLVVSGEVFLISLWYKLSELLPQTSILNIYGSTEVSGDCTYFDCKRLPMLLKSYSLNSVPIGRPISNCNVQLMKDTGLPDEGEICVNGICVACGYISENSIVPFDLVNFSECHSANSCFAKSYIRTGDFATRLRNGDLVFLGRKDRTVKVSGQRVALEEIEDTLRRQPAIADAAVVFNNDEGEHGSLRAYFVLKQNNKLDDTLIISIRNWMIERLFTAMIPKELICIEALPLSSSGKVDYSSLCGSLSKNNYSDELVRAESSELIEKIQQAFCHALSAEVGRDDDFFEMGGDSITAAHVAHNLGIDMRLLYSFPTPLKLENALLKKGLTSMFGNQIDWDGLSESNNTNWLSEQSKVISDMNDGLLSSTPIESISFGGISKLLKMDQSLHVFDWNVNLIDMHAWKLNFMPNSCIVSRCNSVVYSGYEKVNDLSQSWAIDWPQEGTGFLQKQWKVHMDSCVDASPVIVFKDQEILLFIGSHSHKFLCVNAKSGFVQWEAILEGRVECSAAIDGDLSQVIVGCYKGKIYFLDLTSGKICWTFQTHAEVKSQPIVDKSRHLVWSGSHDHNLYALDYKNHCCVYQLPCGGSIFSSPAIDKVHDVLFAVTTNGSLTAVSLRASCFYVMWSLKLEAAVFASLAISIQGNVICCLVNGYVVAVDSEGAIVWKVKVNGPLFAGPSISQSFPSEAIICSRSGSIYSVDVGKGSIIWERNVGDSITASAYIDEHVELVHGSSLPRDRLICICTSSGRILLLKTSMLTSKNDKHPAKTDVEKFAELQLEGEIFSSPVMVAGRIFVGCRDDYFHCLSVGINVEREKESCEKHLISNTGGLLNCNCH